VSDPTRLGAGSVVRAGEAFSIEAVNRLVTEHAALEAIVRDLAGRDPLTDIDPEFGDYVCLLCPDDWDDVEFRQMPADVPHHEDCPWRRAREWVEAHPA
jgi:hypothetical protein